MKPDLGRSMLGTRRWPEVAGWLALAAVLVLLVPLFLRMPLMVDAVFYDTCALHVLRGGALERDFLFLVPPAMVWSMATVRALLGDSSEAMRMVDLGIVAVEVGLLVLWLRIMGLSRAVQIGAAVLLAAFYLTEAEWIHVQPDLWMLLPALLALHLRRRQLTRQTNSASLAGWATVEGICWGAACLFKPFVMVPALLSWLVSLAWWCRTGPGWRRRLALDAAGLLMGGLLMGALWQGWLLTHGTWYDYWHNSAEYRNDFYAATDGFEHRTTGLFLNKFKPWGLFHVLAVPVALAALGRGLLVTILLSPGLEFSPGRLLPGLAGTGHLPAITTGLSSRSDGPSGPYPAGRLGEPAIVANRWLDRPGDRGSPGRERAILRPPQPAGALGQLLARE